MMIVGTVHPDIVQMLEARECLDEERQLEVQVEVDSACHDDAGASENGAVCGSGCGRGAEKSLAWSLDKPRRRRHAQRGGKEMTTLTPTPKKPMTPKTQTEGSTTRAEQESIGAVRCSCTAGRLSDPSWRGEGDAAKRKKGIL